MTATGRKATTRAATTSASSTDETPFGTVARRHQRRLEASAVEQAISEGHSERQVNDGRAEWLVCGETADGTAFEAIYDHPHGSDDGAARIVSFWRLDSE